MTNKLYTSPTSVTIRLDMRLLYLEAPNKNLIYNKRQLRDGSQHLWVKSTNDRWEILTQGQPGTQKNVFMAWDFLW